MGFHKIMCPVDFSPGSREALAAAAELARDHDAPLVLAYVQNPWERVINFQLVPEVTQDATDSEQAEFKKWEVDARARGAQVTTLALSGAPWDQIVSAARKDPAIDLIVLGTHGRTGLAHALVGSVAEKVVRHAPCAVLVVRPREAR